MMKPCHGIMYTIKPGDTFYALSLQYKVPLVVLLRANPNAEVYNLQPGEQICIPVKRNDKFCDSPWNPSCPMRMMSDEEKTETASVPEEESSISESSDLNSTQNERSTEEEAEAFRRGGATPGRPGTYITRRGDTLESVLGLREIPLPPGLRLRFPR